FDKGVIAPFPDAIKAKLHQIRDDAAGTTPSDGDDITVHRGSCLELLPTIAGASVSAVVTSPPYCNRYDYTRTYALELALLGVDDGGVKALRQAMLS
ncbi:restriction endonuclease, partial [Klebsiella pneumoniae]